jgi:hypothetical protein
VEEAMSEDEQPADEEAFAYRTSKDGKVFISWSGRVVTTLSGKAAQRFLARVTGDADSAQLEMARVTGNFKRGNERLAKSRSRR